MQNCFDMPAHGASRLEGGTCSSPEASQPSFEHIPPSPNSGAYRATSGGRRGFLGNVLVLGLGKSGKSVARYCASLLGSRVSSLFIAAGARTDDSVAFVESLVELSPSAARPEASSPLQRGLTAPRSGAAEGLVSERGKAEAFPTSLETAHCAVSRALGPAELAASRLRQSSLPPRLHSSQPANRGEGTSGRAAEGESLPHADISFAFGDDALNSFAEDSCPFDVCIASPGIPYWHELYVRGKQLSRELISEVEFAWRESDPESTWVAITGTNGKTTTTACCAHVLRECGFAANAVGNIGDVCLDAVLAGDTDVYVAELSSYQLYSTPYFAPDVAVMLNITPDHLHWHKTLEAYAEAKFHLLDNLSRRSGQDRGVAILDATNDVVRERVRALRQMSADERGFAYIPMGTAEGIRGDMRARCGAENAAFLDEDDALHVAFAGADHKLAHADELLIKGEHNASNALAAAAVAVVLGADDEAISRGLCSFAPLEHRIEPCGSVDGVDCYNDSKATNVDATLKALAAFPGKRIHVLLGGDDKGTDLSDLVAAVRAHACTAVCFGQAGPRFAEAFGVDADDSGLRLLRADHLADALDTALSVALPDDVVLLSPACASFDEFKSFEQRGDVFKQLVLTRAGAAGHQEV